MLCPLLDQFKSLRSTTSSSPPVLNREWPLVMPHIELSGLQILLHIWSSRAPCWLGSVTTAPRSRRENPDSESSVPFQKDPCTFPLTTPHCGMYPQLLSGVRK